MSVFRKLFSLPNKLASFISGTLVDRKSGAFGFVTAAIGVSADLGTPWVNLLGLICLGVLALVALLAFLAASCRLSKAEKGPLAFLRRVSAKGLAYSIMALLIIAPFYGLQRYMGGDNGVIAEYVTPAAELQAYLDPKFDRLERAIDVLTENLEDQNSAMEDLNEGIEAQTEAVTGLSDTIEEQSAAVDDLSISIDAQTGAVEGLSDQVEDQTGIVTDIQETMTFSVAMNIMDRIRAARDGSNQGQSLAMRTLLASGFDFVGTDYSGVSFRGVVLDGANFSEARLHFVDLRGTSARNASFADSGLRLAQADNTTNFEGADLSGVYAPLFEAPEASFIGANLSGANFHASDLRGADFSNANLTGASFVFADLRGANLSGAVLDGAHFVGSLLTDANIETARFSETNLLGAALDPDLLSEEQRAGACRHQAHIRDSRIKMMEIWESNKYDSGYEYDPINEYDQYVPAGPVDDVSLRLCKSASDSAVDFDATYPLDASFVLHRYYLDRAGREARARSRFKAMRERLEIGRVDAVFFTGDGYYRQQWIQELEANASVVTPVGPSYVDSDLTLVVLLSIGAVSEADVDWDFAFRRRLLLERKIWTSFDGEFARVSHWGPFFPRDVQQGDMPNEAFNLFRDWTLMRASSFGKEITLRPATVIVEGASGNTELSFKTGYMRQTPEGMVASSSWPSHSLAEQAAEAAGGADNLHFAPATTHSYGISLLLYAFPKPLESYELRARTKIDGLKEIVPDVDLTAQIDGWKTIQGYRGNVTLLRISPVSARVHEDGKLQSRKSFELDF
ncbi:pentapeptide repeat-containing protein [Aliiroseovarius sp. S253]|uniref:pentapeptide repeat-containing protein n=1 Tax=Aliiroseovarius sp. S253 TaxID=3415133 RepID=UPI003C7DD92F